MSGLSLNASKIDAAFSLFKSSPLRLALALVAAALVAVAAAGLPSARAADLTVTTGADSFDGVCNAQCSLRDAIVAANQSPGPDTITLPAGEYFISLEGAGEDDGATGDFDITESVSISGEDLSTTTIIAGQIDRAFDIAPDAVAHITGVTISGGEAPQTGNIVETGGGAIRNAGELTLTDSAMESSAAINGGAIFNTGALTLTDSSISGASATERGGGIYSVGHVSLNSSSIELNQAGIAGGGIYAVASDALDMIGSPVSENTVASGPGGGIYLDGQATITSSFINGNSSPVSNGGGIYVFGGTASLVLTDVSLNSSGEGAGIFNRGSLTLDDSSVTGNAASVAGGGISNDTGALATLTRSSVSGNQVTGPSTGKGGGIFGAAGGEVSISESAVHSNSAIDGGGVFNRGLISLANSTVSANSASSLGGGLFNEGAGNVNIVQSTVAANEAAVSAGGVWQASDGAVVLKNSIVASNVGGLSPACGGGDLLSGGHNIVDNITGCGFVPASTDLTGDDATPVNPGITPLQDNGGPTFSHALISTSVAIDFVPVTDCVDLLGAPIISDQLDVLRPLGAGCDAGSIEFPPLDFTITGTLAASAAIAAAEQPFELLFDGTDLTLPASWPGSQAGVDAVKLMTAHVGQVSGPAGRFDFAGLYVFNTALDAIVMCVRDSVEMDFLTGITLSQIATIYSAGAGIASLTWQDIDGSWPATPVTPIATGETSDLRLDFLALTGISDSAETDTVASTGGSRANDPLAAADSCAATEGAIGYTTLANVSHSGMRVIPVEGVTPDATTLLDLTYPLTREIYHLVPTKQAAPRDNPAVVRGDDLINFLYSIEGQALLQASGLVPLSPLSDPAIPDADTNLDGIVNILDVIPIAVVFGETTSIVGAVRADVNNDGTVNILDTIPIANSFQGAGFTPPPAP